MTKLIIYANILIMKHVIPIHEAKTNLSKLVKQAIAGKTIYIGAYGQPQAIITSLPETKNKLITGAWIQNNDVMIPDNFDDIDSEINKMFENSVILSSDRQ